MPPLITEHITVIAAATILGRTAAEVIELAEIGQLAAIEDDGRLFVSRKSVDQFSGVSS